MQELDRADVERQPVRKCPACGRESRCSGADAWWEVLFLDELSGLTRRAGATGGLHAETVEGKTGDPCDPQHEEAEQMG